MKKMHPTDDIKQAQQLLDAIINIQPFYKQLYFERVYYFDGRWHNKKEGYEYYQNLFSKEPEDPLKIRELDDYYENLNILATKNKEQNPKIYSELFLYKCKAFKQIAAYHLTIKEIKFKYNIDELLWSNYNDLKRERFYYFDIVNEYYDDIEQHFEELLILNSSLLEEVIMEFAITSLAYIPFDPKAETNDALVIFDKIREQSRKINTDFFAKICLIEIEASENVSRRINPLHLGPYYYLDAFHNTICTYLENGLFDKSPSFFEICIKEAEAICYTIGCYINLLECPIKRLNPLRKNLKTIKQHEKIRQDKKTFEELEEITKKIEHEIEYYSNEIKKREETEQWQKKCEDAQEQIEIALAEGKKDVIAKHYLIQCMGLKILTDEYNEKLDEKLYRVSIGTMHSEPIRKILESIWSLMDDKEILNNSFTPDIILQLSACCANIVGPNLRIEKSTIMGFYHSFKKILEGNDFSEIEQWNEIQKNLEKTEELLREKQ